MPRSTSCSRRPRFWGAPLLALALGAGVTACEDVLDVSNPNNVVGEDLLLTTAMKGVVNGALFTVQAGYAYMLAPYSTVSDELHWIGSRDAWFELELGTPDNPANEFTDAAFKDFAPGRWMADEAIEIMQMHVDSGVAGADTLLARAKLYAGIIYVTIADWFDDFALSDRRDVAPPIGEDNMNTLYTTAIGYLTDALATTGISSDLRRNLLAVRARAYHSAGVWSKIGPSSATFPVANPLVTDANAVADANAALAVDNSDWIYQFDYGASTVWSDIGWEVNARLELRFSDDYIIPTADDNGRDVTAPDNGIALQDPLDGVGDPRLAVIMAGFEAGERYADLTIATAREMYLILAEDALARGDTAAFTTNINQVRTMGGMTNMWSTASATTAQDMLIHERRVNLYLQGRRLNDMYRFGIQSSMWQPTRSAVTNPGTFLPITKAEIDANCFLNPEWPPDVPCP
ncbi:MAG: RagB/SusD family nutrient uptake outer membrane protein [Gemmatimonadales bacterium]